MSVLAERAGPVTTITLDRPEVRNAVDGPTADALAEAFTEFDADADPEPLAGVSRFRSGAGRGGAPA